MKSLFAILITFLVSGIPATTQNIENVLDLIPGGGNKKLAESGITGFIDYQFSGEISKSRDEVNQFSVVFMDSFGRIIKSVKFNRFKKPENFFCNTYDENGKLNQRVHYGPGGALLWREGFFYDVSGRLIERIEYAKDGAVDGKTLYFYNRDGHLYKTRQLNHKGEPAFWQIIYYSAKNLPERITLKQARGFTMSNTLIRYNDYDLPVEKKVSAGLKGPVSHEEFFYDGNQLLAEQRSFNDGDLTDINIRAYSRGNFGRMVMEKKLHMDDSLCPEQCCDPIISGFISQASFPGGIIALEGYLNSAVKMIESPPQQGVVMVKFEVKSNGKIRKERVLKGLAPSLDEMAVDIVDDMPRWNPAKSKNGETINSNVYLPIVFLK